MSDKVELEMIDKWIDVAFSELVSDKTDTNNPYQKYDRKLREGNPHYNKDDFYGTIIYRDEKLDKVLAYGISTRYINEKQKKQNYSHTIIFRQYDGIEKDYPDLYPEGIDVLFGLKSTKINNRKNFKSVQLVKWLKKYHPQYVSEGNKMPTIEELKTQLAAAEKAAKDSGKTDVKTLISNSDLEPLELLDIMKAEVLPCDKYMEALRMLSLDAIKIIGTEQIWKPMGKDSRLPELLRKTLRDSL